MRTKRIRQGIKETLEYVAFLRLGEESVSGDGPEEIFGDGWNGLLVVQELESEIASLEEQTENETEILQASELDGELQQILEQVI